MAMFRWDQTSRCFSAVVAGLQLHQHFASPVSLSLKNAGSGIRGDRAGDGISPVGAVHLKAYDRNDMDQWCTRNQSLASTCVR